MRGSLLVVAGLVRLESGRPSDEATLAGVSPGQDIGGETGKRSCFLLSLVVTHHERPGADLHAGEVDSGNGNHGDESQEPGDDLRHLGDDGEAGKVRQVPIVVQSGPPCGVGRMMKRVRFSPPSPMATVLDTLQKGTVYLQRHGVEEARLNMQYLLAHALKCDRMQLYLDFDRPLSEEDLEKLRDLTKRRAKGEPLQHLMGTVEFCGREFASDARALIPRPETEELVERLRKLRDWKPDVRILDMGAGSGVIGLSLAADLAERQPRVVLADLSPEALALASENLERLGLDGSGVERVESDLFSAIGGPPFDLIVANLPYVPESERTELSREVRRDPELALFGGGDQGTDVMRRFLSEVGSHLVPGGVVAMEFGEGQAGELAAAAEEAGLEEVEIATDLSGRERFLFAVNPAVPA